MPGDPSPAVLVVSHDPVVRARLLAAHPSGRCAEAASAGEAVLGTRATGPGDLAVVDLELPDPLVTDLVGLLRDEGWAVVLVLVPRDGTDAALAAVAAGAHGVLVSTADRVRAVVPVAAVLAGAGVPALTSREKRVLALVAGGAGNREVAAVVGVSPLTVKAHLARVAQKLGTGDRAGMVAVALRAGLIG